MTPNPETSWDLILEQRAEMERDWFADEYRQSTTACCPRQTIPDSCSCPEGCGCLCADCECGTGCDCGDQAEEAY